MKIAEAPDAVKAALPAGGFRTDDHRYYWNGQGPVPGVTGIIDVLSKPAVTQWLAQESVKAIYQAFRNAAPVDGHFIGMKEESEAVKWAIGQAYSQRDTAAQLGSSVHLIADMVPTASESDQEGWKVSEQVQPYLAAFRAFLGRYTASSIISSEKMVWSANGYGGTYDLLMKMDGGLWLIDIKTSKGYYPEYGLQLAAYRWADHIMLPGDPRAYPMPSIQHTGILHLRPDQYPDTGWRLIEYPTTYEKDYMAFLGALEVQKWRAEGRFRKSVLEAKKD